MKYIYRFVAIALAVILMAHCNQPDKDSIRRSREAEWSGMELKHRQIHAQQRFGRLTVSGTKIEEFFDPWIIGVSEIAPKMDGHVKMAPLGKIMQRHKMTDKNDPVTIDLTGKSPLESLNIICDTFDVYFAYTTDWGVVLGSTKKDLISRDPDHGDQKEKDPFTNK